MTINAAEGLRRVFVVIGAMLAAGILLIGWSDRPTAGMKEYYASRVMMGAAADALSREGSGRFTTDDIKSQWFKTEGDGEIIKSLCSGVYKDDPVMKAECADHRAEMDGLPWEQFKHLSVLVGAAALAYGACLLLCSVLVWIGRGFMPPTAPPRQ